MLLFKNRYEVDKNIIHQSFSSTVYKGLDIKNKLPVAIKQIKFNPYVFESEKNSLKKLNHPNIIKLIDYFKENNFFYIVTEWFEGLPVNQFSFSPEEWIEVFINILKGMKYIHENGMFHRDLKPQNILISKDNQVKIIDFGISIFEKDADEENSKILGTLTYISPEQTGYLKSTPDNRSDIYSLGVIFYECLTGANPFNGKDETEIIHQHLTFTPPSLVEKLPKTNLIERLNQIIFKMIEKDITHRFSDVTDIIQELEEILKIHFPLFSEQEIVLREEWIKKCLADVPDFLSQKKAVFLIKGKYGSGKTFLIKKIIHKIQESRKVLRLRITNTNSFSFLEEVSKNLDIPMQEIKSGFQELSPVLVVENIQRIDEASWNSIIQGSHFLIAATYDEDEDFSLLQSTDAAKYLYEITPYNQEEIGVYLDTVFNGKLDLSGAVFNHLLRFCQGNLEVLSFGLKMLYRKKLLIFQNEKWVFVAQEKIFSLLDQKNIMNFQFSELDEDMKEFLKNLSVYGFLFNSEQIKKLRNYFNKNILQIKKYLKHAEGLGILEKSKDSYNFINRNLYAYFYFLNTEEERKEKHLKIARAIEKIKDFDQKFNPLFYHYSLTDDSLKAYIWGRRLLSDLIEKYAYSQAIDVFEKLTNLFYKTPNKTPADFISFYELLEKAVNVYIFKGYYDRIIPLLKEQIKFFSGDESKERLAGVYLSLGRIYSLKGEQKNVREWYNKALNLIESLNQIKVIKKIYENICMNYIFSSRFREAIFYFEKAQQFYQAEDYQDTNIMVLLGVIAFAYANLGKYDKVHVLLKTIEDLLRKEKNPYFKYIGLHYRILVLSHMGEIENLKEEELESYLTEISQEENKLLQYSLYFSIGYFYFKKGKYQKAHDYVEKSLQIAESFHVGVGILMPQLIFAEILIKLKKYGQISQIFQSAQKIIEINKDYFCVQWLLRLKALLLSYSMHANADKIKKIMDKAINLSKKLKLKSELARNYYYYSVILFNIGKMEKGFAYERKSLKYFTQLGMKWEENQMKSTVLSYSIQASQKFFSQKLKIDALSKISFLIAKQKNSKELFSEIMKMAIEISGVNKGCLFIHHKDKLYQVYDQGMSKDFSVPEVIYKTLLEKREPFIGEDTLRKSFLYLPISYQTNLMGIIYLENNLIQNLFHPEQLKVMNILSSVFGVLIENTRTYLELEREKNGLEKKVEERTKEVYLRNQIIEKDLAATRIFQQNLMPKEMPKAFNSMGNFYYQPVEEIGGDFYDFIPLDQDRLLFVIADSAGHGIRASLLTAMLKTAIYNYPDKTYSSIKNLIDHVNESLYGQVSDKYIVCLIGILDRKVHNVYMIGGGNIEIYYYAATTKKWQKIDIKGHMLGIIPTNLLRISDRTIEINPGDKLLFSTDGLTEQYYRDSNGDRVMFGAKMFHEVLEKNQSPKNLLKELIAAVNRFTGKTSFSDDITGIVFWRNE